LHVKRTVIQGFKTLRMLDIEFAKGMNVLVGDNESGKTTVVQAVNLAVSCQIHGRNISYDLDPYYFNAEVVSEYFAAVRQGQRPAPPRILIEIYFEDDDAGELARYRGTNNTKGEDCPGLYLLVDVNEDLLDEFLAYVTDQENPVLVPVEYYSVAWRSFADNSVVARGRPFKATVIEPSSSRSPFRTDQYLARVIDDCLDDAQRVALAAAYRNLKQRFSQEPGIEEVNAFLMEKKGDISTKTLSVSLDMSARSTWDSSITAYLDDIPFTGVGKGEQSRVQTKLAIGAATKSSLLLIEEPENHLSHSNMSQLMDEISSQGEDQQVIITTHSSFVLNKLGIDALALLRPGRVMKLEDLPADTVDYFMKLPGYDTLRLLLSERAILVEGPSDELVVQKAYLVLNGKLPLADRVDVISVGNAFLRFLQIGVELGLEITVVTDNDGDLAKLQKKYELYLCGQHPSIDVLFDTDTTCPTLEPQLLGANGLESLNAALGTEYADEDSLLAFMANNKTECALRLFESGEKLEFPEYIRNAVRR